MFSLKAAGNHQTDQLPNDERHSPDGRRLNSKTLACLGQASYGQKYSIPVFDPIAIYDHVGKIAVAKACIMCRHSVGCLCRNPFPACR
jgi:hypothetical protein